MKPTIANVRSILEPLTGAGFASFTEGGHCVYESVRCICADGHYRGMDEWGYYRRTVYYTVRFPKKAPIDAGLWSVRFRYGTGPYARYHGDAEYVEDCIAESIADYPGG